LCQHTHKRAGSTVGQCQDCATPSIVDDAHHTCSACSPGEEANADRGVWHAKALLTPALALNAHHVMVNSWSTAIEQRALHVAPVLVPISSRQIASSVWKDGTQRSECVLSALSRMSSLLTELAVLASMCSAGTHCTDPAGCDNQDDCTACSVSVSVGAVSVSGGLCHTCSEPGKVANSEQTFCD
jgi:hypothetical protein